MASPTIFDIHVVVADNDRFLTGGLMNLLAEEPGIIVQDHVHDFNDLCKVAAACKPEVIILESKLQGIVAPAAIKKLVAAGGAAIILYEDSVTAFHFQYYYNKHIRGIVRKGQPPQILLSAIREVWHGGKYYCCYTQKLLKECFFITSGKQLFSDTQLHILQHLFEGKTRKEIPGLRCLSEEAIDSSIHKMLGKCRCTNATALVGFATHHRFIKQDAHPGA